jgi:hypothetical protein
MKVKEIVRGVPLDELLATIEIGYDMRGVKMPEHVTNVALLAHANPNVEVSNEVATYVTDWFDTQRRIQHVAQNILARLEAEAPLPTPDQLISGNPDWPAWVGCWWAGVLRVPWAGLLGVAVAEAMVWLDERQS